MNCFHLALIQCVKVPECPVVSPVSGQVYERRLLEKFISDNGTDPVTREPLSVDQLIEIKCSPLVKPKPPSATSIPAILKSLQDEWDATMLHSFTLRQQLQVCKCTVLYFCTLLYCTIMYVQKDDHHCH